MKQVNDLRKLLADAIRIEAGEAVYNAIRAAIFVANTERYASSVKGRESE